MKEYSKSGMTSFPKSKGKMENASKGRVTQKQKAVDFNPKGRVVPMGGCKHKGEY